MKLTVERLKKIIMEELKESMVDHDFARMQQPPEDAPVGDSEDEKLPVAAARKEFKNIAMDSELWKKVSANEANMILKMLKTGLDMSNSGTADQKLQKGQDKLNQVSGKK